MFDLENGNWKNSEVMRIFAQSVTDINTESQAPEIKQEVVVENTVALSEAEIHEILKSAEEQAGLNHLINELNVIAEDASKENNLRAAAEIEIAIEDLKTLF